jgi:protein MpaA
VIIANLIKSLYAVIKRKKQKDKTMPTDNDDRLLDDPDQLSVHQDSKPDNKLKLKSRLKAKNLRIRGKVRARPFIDIFLGAELLIRLRLAQVFKAFWRYRKVITIITSCSLLSIIMAGFIVFTFLPPSIHYSFADHESCIDNPAIFPNLFKSSPKTIFSLTRIADVSIGKTPIFSYKLCAKLNSAPAPQVTYTNHQQLSIGGLHINRSVRIITPNFPSVASVNLDAKAIPINKPIVFKLNQFDATFDYAIVANGQTSHCSKQKTTLTCSLTPLKFSYADSYKTSLNRAFHGQIAGSVLSKAVQTITATAITQTSIDSGAIVYDKPQGITLQTNKAISGLQSISLSTINADGTTNIPIASSFSGNTITVNFTNQLPRQASFDLHIDNLTASDQSTLQQPYDLIFTTSGGPQVTGVNLPSYGVAFNQSIILTFNQALLASQNVSSLASLTVNGVAQPASYSLSGDQLIIQPTDDFPVCATVNVQLNDQAQNDFGISGNSAWSFTTRSHCYTTFSIGTSVEGRPIIAYQFGSGPSMVLYIGAMEGNEQNSSKLLSQWITNVDANPGKIPSYRTLVIIPTINPDGFAADTRLNADGIDLNRNFPSNNWQTAATEPTAPSVWTNDGGPYPLSEPESQALANYYTAHLPRLTLTMHSHGGIVEANDAGGSDSLGAQYASLADYEAIPTYAIGNFFDYTTTGAFEDWANNKLGLPVLEVELESATSDEYSRNLPALWAMAQVSP